MLRDRYRCQICGTRRRARELDVDHIVEIAVGGAALEYSNLQTVCRQCHRAKTRAFMADVHRHSKVLPPDAVVDDAPGAGGRPGTGPVLSESAIPPPE